MIALNADVAFLGQSVVGVLRELARRDLGLPVGTAEVIFDDFLAVQPMLDMVAIDDDARLVPLAKRLDHACGRTIQAVRRPRRGEPAAAIGRVGVIQQLILRAAPVNVVVFARGAIEDAAVALLADFPVNLELEIAELLLGHQVIDRAFLGERAVYDVPALRHALRAPTAKGVEHFSVEQRVPLGLRRPLGARRATRAARARQQPRARKQRRLPDHPAIDHVDLHSPRATAGTNESRPGGGKSNVLPCSALIYAAISSDTTSS